MRGREQPSHIPVTTASARERQKERTRSALVDAARALIQSGGPVTMPAVARAAGVSDATAYRHFPDLLAILNDGFVGVWPDVAEEAPGLAQSRDPVERIGIVTEFLARNVLSVQGAVRARIGLTVTRPDETAGVRPAYRVNLIEEALAPVSVLSPDQLEQLKLHLAVVVSAESLFTLLDLCRLEPDRAVAALTVLAQGVVRAALADHDREVEQGGRGVPRTRGPVSRRTADPSKRGRRPPGQG